jgi:hypothetical protein
VTGGDSALKNEKYSKIPGPGLDLGMGEEGMISVISANPLSLSPPVPERLISCKGLDFSSNRGTVSRTYI